MAPSYVGCRLCAIPQKCEGSYGATVLKISAGRGVRPAIMDDQRQPQLKNIEAISAREPAQFTRSPRRSVGTAFFSADCLLLRNNEPGLSFLGVGHHAPGH